MVRPRQRKKYSSFMIPKPLQFLLLAPLAFGALVPKFFIGVFALGLAALALWWAGRVLAMLFGD